MKNYLLLFFLGFSLFSIAQSKLTFEYDAAGNQTKRELCLSNCNSIYKTAAPKDTIVPKEIEALQEEDLQKFSPEETFSYYPNPVKEELYLKWQFVEGKVISSVYLYALNGQTLKTYDHLEKENALNIPFYNYPTGTYLVVLIYNDGEQKTIKIVK